MEKSNVIAVRDFLNHNTPKPVQMSEMQEFWKVCSEQEKQAFGDSARAQNKALGVAGY